MEHLHGARAWTVTGAVCGKSTNGMKIWTTWVETEGEGGSLGGLKLAPSDPDREKTFYETLDALGIDRATYVPGQEHVLTKALIGVRFLGVMRWGLVVPVNVTEQCPMCGGAA